MRSPCRYKLSCNVIQASKRRKYLVVATQESILKVSCGSSARGGKGKKHTVSLAETPQHGNIDRHLLDSSGLLLEELPLCTERCMSSKDSNLNRSAEKTNLLRPSCLWSRDSASSQFKRQREEHLSQVSDFQTCTVPLDKHLEKPCWELLCNKDADVTGKEKMRV